MSKNMRVNCFDLGSLSTSGELPSDVQQYLSRKVDPDNEQDVKAAIRLFVLKLMSDKAWWPAKEELLRVTLKYFLTRGNFGDVDIEDVYYAPEPAFPLPTSPMNYYRWAWDVLFPGQEYHLDSLKGFEEANER